MKVEVKSSAVGVGLEVHVPPLAPYPQSVSVATSLASFHAFSGLPTSLQIVCRGYDEAMALRIGQAYQRATDWHLRRPPIG